MKKRLVLIDYLKAICVLLVILTHGSNINTQMLDKTGLFYLLVVNKCVPVFMFLSGYVYTLGSEKRLSTEYSLKTLIPKLLRLIIPTVIAYMVFLIASSPQNFVERFVLGDFGPGSYYFSVMVQFVLLAPVMYALVKKLNKWGVVIIGVTNLIYELAAVAGDIDIKYYRIIFLRYLLIVAFGMYFGINKEKKLNYVLLGTMGTVGIIYILLPYVFDYQYQVFTISPWNRSNMMSSFYVAVVVAIILKLFENAQEEGLLSRVVSYMGVASYHIMYTQMLYFVARPATDKVFDITVLPILVQYVVDIVVPVSSGMLFCVLDNKIFGKIYKYSSKK